MVQYLKNLLKALMGLNPYQMELRWVTEKYEKLAAHVEALQSIYDEEVEKASRCKSLLDNYQSQVQTYQSQMLAYQNLVENLRERVSDYQRRIEEYNIEMDKLQTPKASNLQ